MRASFSYIHSVKNPVVHAAYRTVHQTASFTMQEVSFQAQPNPEARRAPGVVQEFPSFRSNIRVDDSGIWIYQVERSPWQERVRDIEQRFAPQYDRLEFLLNDALRAMSYEDERKTL